MQSVMSMSKMIWRLCWLFRCQEMFTCFLVETLMPESLQQRLEVTDHEIQLFSDVPTALNVNWNAFSVTQNKVQCIIVLTRQGPFVLRRDHGMTIEDVTTVIDHNSKSDVRTWLAFLGRNIADGWFVRMLSLPWIMNPLRMILRFWKSWIFTWMTVGCPFHWTGHCWKTSQNFCKVLLWSMSFKPWDGWSWLILKLSLIMTSIGILWSEGQVRYITQEDLVYCLAIHFFLLKIRTRTVAGNNPAVRCKIKLWHVWIWDALVDPSISLNHFDDVWKSVSRIFMIENLGAWDQASSIVGDHMEIRLVSHVALVNPDLALKNYPRCGPDDKTTAVITFVGALRDGGPASNQQELNIQQKNGLASFLMSQGADLKECLIFKDSILKGAGASAVSSILGQKLVAKKREGLTQWRWHCALHFRNLVKRSEVRRRKPNRNSMFNPKVSQRTFLWKIWLFKVDMFSSLMKRNVSGWQRLHRMCQVSSSSGMRKRGHGWTVRSFCHKTSWRWWLLADATINTLTTAKKSGASMLQQWAPHFAGMFAPGWSASCKRCHGRREHDSRK